MYLNLAIEEILLMFVLLSRSPCPLTVHNLSGSRLTSKFDIIMKSKCYYCPRSKQKQSNDDHLRKSFIRGSPGYYTLIPLSFKCLFMITTETLLKWGGKNTAQLFLFSAALNYWLLQVPLINLVKNKAKKLNTYYFYFIACA